MATKKKGITVQEQRLLQRGAVLKAKQAVDDAKERYAEEKRKLKALPTK